MTDTTFDVVEVTKEKIACDGHDQASGHPRVYLQIDPSVGHVVCPYCSCKFALKAAA